MTANPACKTFIPNLSPFIDGELSVGDRTNVERHLSACRDCTARVADLRAESGLIRVGLEMAADQVDFKDFANNVMARITPERPSAWEGIKLSMTEMFTYQRRMMVASLAGAAAAVVLLVPVLLQSGTPFGYAGGAMAVESVNAPDEAHVAPVVMRTEGGDSIIWLVDHDHAAQETAPSPDPAVDEEMDPDSDVPGGPMRKALKNKDQPQGGEL
jgi:anti-sigma factor RsiW